MLSNIAKFIKLLLILFFTACNEDVDLYTNGSPVPIVYSLLDPTSDIQYVRIGRSFMESIKREEVTQIDLSLAKKILDIG